MTGATRKVAWSASMRRGRARTELQSRCIVPPRPYTQPREQHPCHVPPPPYIVARLASCHYILYHYPWPSSAHTRLFDTFSERCNQVHMSGRQAEWQAYDYSGKHERLSSSKASHQPVAVGAGGLRGGGELAVHSARPWGQMPAHPRPPWPCAPRTDGACWRYRRYLQRERCRRLG